MAPSDQPGAPSPDPTTPTTTPTPEQPQWHGTHPVVHYGALTALILCPSALLLPPARGRGSAASMAQNLLLFGGGFWGASQLAHDFTGKSIWRRTNERIGRAGSAVLAPLDDLPAKAKQNKLLMEAERARRTAALPEAERMVAEEEARVKEEKKEASRRGIVQRIWMGGETREWKEKRLEEERKALDEGKGYSDLIIDQVKEVFGMGGKKDGKEAKLSGVGEGEKR